MKLDISLLEKFENKLDTNYPERGPIPIKILGYGEISLVFELLDDHQPIAYKRLPIFETEAQVKRHIKAFEIYHILLDKLGIKVPEESYAWFKTPQAIVLYCAQNKQNENTLANRIIHDNIDFNSMKCLLNIILQKLIAIWKFNKHSKHLKIGIDGQLSNWAFPSYSLNSAITPNSQVVYLDTSTPMFRIKGIDAMEPLLFLKSAPSFLRWLLEMLFLEEVVERYYDLKSVLIDLIANLYKEQKPELIPIYINIINSYLDEHAPELGVKPLTYEEIYTYYNGFLGDKQIWVIFQSTRRIDRYLQTRMLNKKYNFYLPGKIQR